MSSCPACNAVRPADIVLRGAPIYTVDADRPWVQAIAIRDGILTAVGTEQEVALHAGPTTRVVELPPDHLVLPGFIDSHIHYTHGPFDIAGIDLSESDTVEDVRTVLENADRSSPVVTGAGWRSHLFPNGPHRRFLDDIFADTPVILREINGHSAWANSAALAAAGITRATPDPEPGYSMFVRDETGEPTGWVLEDAVMAITDALVPEDTEVVAQELDAFQPRYAAAGLTGVFDAGIFADERECWRKLVELDEKGRLKQRVVAAKVANLDPENAVSLLESASRDFRSRNVSINTLKIMVDGTPEGHTSAMLDPYSDRPDTKGPLAVAPETIRGWAIESDRAGYACHFHALGDRAVRVALDAIEAAREVNGRSGVVHTICHANLIDPSDLPRFRDLGVVYQTSSQWIGVDPFHAVMKTRIGARADRQYPLRTAANAGIIVTLGADFPTSSYISTYRPLVLIESAVIRRTHGKRDATPLPPSGEALTLPEAIRAMTASAAYQIGEGYRTGSLRVGKLADLVVLEGNLFEIHPHEIASTGIALTMLGGLVTHGALP